MALALSHLAREYIKTPKGSRQTPVRVPVLVWELPSAPQGAESGAWLLTGSGSKPRRPRAGEPLVFLLQKAPSGRNPFAMGITVGRVETNDVVVEDSSVSRFHAWFQFDQVSSAWFLTDAESKNGTYLEGQKLPANVRSKLQDGANLAFGDTQMRFMTPETFGAYLERMLSH